jgi:hypothetical protein
MTILPTSEIDFAASNMNEKSCGGVWVFAMYVDRHGLARCFARNRLAEHRNTQRRAYTGKP